MSPIFAISHVRDALIAPVDRMALAECWTDACIFIAKNESRVREETQLIKGEEYLVWRLVSFIRFWRHEENITYICDFGL